MNFAVVSRLIAGPALALAVFAAAPAHADEAPPASALAGPAPAAAPQAAPAQVAPAPVAPAQAAPAQASAKATEAAQAEAPRDLSKYKEESVPGGQLMIIAYLVMWGLLGSFAVRTALRQGKLEREVAALQDRVDKGA
jgi:hypothetical protein